MPLLLLGTAVDEPEQRVGVGGGSGVHRVGPQEADTDHEAVALAHEQVQAVGAIGVTGRRGFRRNDAEILDRLIEAFGGRVVERLVAATRDVEQQADGLAFAAAPPAGAVVSAPPRACGCLGVTRAGVFVIVSTAGRDHKAERRCGCEDARKFAHFLPLLGWLC